MPWAYQLWDGPYIITFKDTYWVYGGNVPGEHKGLTIGGFEPAFFIDLVAAYILKTSRELFSNMIYDRNYRDDELTVTEGKNPLKSWLIDSIFSKQK